MMFVECGGSEMKWADCIRWYYYDVIFFLFALSIIQHPYSPQVAACVSRKQNLVLGALVRGNRIYRSCSSGISLMDSKYR